MRVALCICVLLLTGAFPNSAPAVMVWNLDSDFSIVGDTWGTAQAWSAGMKLLDGTGVPTGQFYRCPQASDGGWYLARGGQIYDGGTYVGRGEIWKNLGAWNYGIPTGWVSIDGDYDFTSTVRWTAPTAGTVDLTAWFGVGDWGTGRRGIFHNQSFLWDGGWQGTIDGGLFSDIAVNAGDTIDFNVWQSDRGGNTPVDARIELTPLIPVPEPGAFALLALGLPAAFVFARRRGGN
jgi:hypothetical protein